MQISPVMRKCVLQAKHAPASRKHLRSGYLISTGKSLSEALIFASTKPQYDDRLFIELQVQYIKTTSSEHGENMLCTENVLNVKNNFCTQHVLPTF